MTSTPLPNGSQAPSFELTMNQGPLSGQHFTLTKPVTAIGRSLDNDIVVDIQDVSRSHARITWDGNQVVIEDLGSPNGTFVNGVRLTGPQVLNDSDTIGLADTVSFAVRATGPALIPALDVDEALVQSPPGPAQPPQSQPRLPPLPRVGGRRLVWISAVVLVGFGAVLTVAAVAGYFYFRQQGDVTKPAVSISSPQLGTQVEVGQPVTVDSVTYDKRKIVRVELWADGNVQKVKNSILPDGMSPFPMSADWLPNSAGNHSLVVRAFNRKGDRGQAEITVEAAERADRDDDDIPDEEDACPDEPGSVTAAGCPDRDLDGVPDAEDASPDEPGPPETGGYPAPTGDDRDGDGVPDDVDDCPDELGSSWTDGCPDRDLDGVLDPEDECPVVWGVPEYDGCLPPDDRDGDGVLDEVDVCADEYGSPEADGCPDRDGDTVPDSDDLCFDLWGLPELEGCPDTPGDGPGSDEDWDDGSEWTGSDEDWDDDGDETGDPDPPLPLPLPPWSSRPSNSRHSVLILHSGASTCRHGKGLPCTAPWAGGNGTSLQSWVEETAGM